MAATGTRRLRRAVPWLRSPLLFPSPGLFRRRARLALRGTLAALAGVLPDLLAVEFLLAVTAFIFRDALVEGFVFHEADTTTMFYPIFAALGSALRRGELLLWSPQLFTGFPLLAEGQTGVLYPPNRLAATLLPTEEGFTWLRIGHFAAASLSAYVFGRSLWLAPGAAAVLALSFAFGSFMVGQMQHASVVASAIWLPVVLALTEFGFRARGRARQRCFVLAGLGLGMSALGVHMQPVVMSGGCFMGWMAFRLVFPPRQSVSPPSDPSTPLPADSRRSLPKPMWWRLAGRRPISSDRPLLRGRRAIPNSAELAARGLARLVRSGAARSGLILWTATLVPMIALSVAAAQLLPLYELSRLSGRATGGWSYAEATDYSLPFPNLITLVFPFFFRDEKGGGWSLWQPWEVTYYAGVVPLALAVLAIFSARRREVLFFVPLVVVSTLLALGDYSPINLYEQVWTWPGINLQRAPARFSYLGVLGIAALAGLGTQVLWENLRSGPGGYRPSARFLVLWMSALVVSLVGLVWQLVGWRAWLSAEPLWARKYIDQNYLSLRHDPGVVDSAEQVFGGLWQSLDIANPHTALSLLLLAVLLLLVVCWNELRRARPFWQALLVLLVAVDLGSFAHGYHPLVSIADIADVGDSGRFLAQQNGLFRAYTDPEVKRPRANALLPWGVPEARAYDPLELSRQRVLLGSAAYVDDWLFDLLGVRFRLEPAVQPGQPSHHQTAFNPQHPLVSGTAHSPSGTGAWVIPGDRADELRVVSVLEDAFGLGDGEPVADWVLTDTSGAERVITMRAGRDTAEWSYDDPLHAIRPLQSRAQVAFTFDLPYPLASGARHVNLYFASFSLPDGPRIARAEFRYTHPVGRMQVYGFGLFDQERGQMAQFYGRDKYQLVFRDADVLMLENRAAFPRAFAVPESIVAPTASAALDLLAHGPLRPRRQVVLEADDPATQTAEATAPAPVASDLPESPIERLGAPYGRVDVVEYSDDRVTVRTATEGGYLVVTDAYYPGWKAYLDGHETPLLRANYLFRAVALPPGQHLVQFQFKSPSFEAGLVISRLALACVVLVLLVTCLPSGRMLRPVWFRTP